MKNEAKTLIDIFLRSSLDLSYAHRTNLNSKFDFALDALIAARSIAQAACTLTHVPSSIASSKLIMSQK